MNRRTDSFVTYNRQDFIGSNGSLRVSRPEPILGTLSIEVSDTDVYLPLAEVDMDGFYTFEQEHEGHKFTWTDIQPVRVGDEAWFHLPKQVKQL